MTEANEKDRGGGEKATTPAYSGTIMFDESGHRNVSFWSVLKGMYALHIKQEVGQKLFGAQGACLKTGRNTDCEERIDPLSLSLSHSLLQTIERAPSAELTRDQSLFLSVKIYSRAGCHKGSTYLKGLVNKKAVFFYICKCYAFCIM